MRSIALLMLVTVPALADTSLGLEPQGFRRGFQNENRFLGWTAEGRAVFRHAAHWTADGSGFEYFQVALVTAGRDDTRSETLLDVRCEEDPSCPAMTPEVVQRFIAAERAALDRLPPLRRTAPAADPAGAAGPAGRLTLVARPIPDDEGAFAVHLALARPHRSTQLLKVIAERDFGRLVDRRIVAAWPSPDGKRAAVVVSYGTKEGCWDPSIQYGYMVIDRPAAGAESQ